MKLSAKQAAAPIGVGVARAPISYGVWTWDETDPWAIPENLTDPLLLELWKRKLAWRRYDQRNDRKRETPVAGRASHVEYGVRAYWL